MSHVSVRPCVNLQQLDDFFVCASATLWHLQCETKATCALFEN